MDAGKNAESRGYLTTTQAAKLLSVSPDTVLKWVRAGKIQSHRTLGGHFRICIDDLNLQGEAAEAGRGNRRAAAAAAFQFCWEYFPSGGSMRAKCKKCIAFRSRARRCYELRDLPEGIGCLEINCTSSCEQCDYFKLVKAQGPNIIVLGEKAGLLKDWDKGGSKNDAQIRFVDNEYECALVVQEFRPDFIVVDCRIGRERIAALYRSLIKDSRIPVARIILASKTRKTRDYCDRKIFAWIKKPFALRKLLDCIEGA